MVEELLPRFRERYTDVVVAHNLQQTRRIADYAAFFRATVGTGSPIDDGTGEQIFETPQPTLTVAYVNAEAC
ncbi:hypothetical protein [Novipirellula rosea]|uniref:Uncharacterized protein n=1 Tax=Novipirellula rosea TaxID=1031540 RepID=A0ABP8MR95_9BACT